MSKNVDNIRKKTLAMVRVLLYNNGREEAWPPPIRIRAACVLPNPLRQNFQSSLFSPSRPRGRGLGSFQPQGTGNLPVTTGYYCHISRGFSDRLSAWRAPMCIFYRMHIGARLFYAVRESIPTDKSVGKQSLSRPAADSSLYTREPQDIAFYLNSTRMNVHLRTFFHLIRVHFVHPPSPHGQVRGDPTE